jgi:hypothetical protein
MGCDAFAAEAMSEPPMRISISPRRRYKRSCASAPLFKHPLQLEGRVYKVCFRAHYMHFSAKTSNCHCACAFAKLFVICTSCVCGRACASSYDRVQLAGSCGSRRYYKLDSDARSRQATLPRRQWQKSRRGSALQRPPIDFTAPAVTIMALQQVLLSA